MPAAEKGWVIELNQPNNPLGPRHPAAPSEKVPEMLKNHLVINYLVPTEAHPSITNDVQVDAMIGSIQFLLALEGVSHGGSGFMPLFVGSFDPQ